MSKQLTKRAITDSFMKLLNERPLDKITVKDIVVSCGINRNTFYYHYQDIFALLEDIFETQTKEVIEQHRDLASWQDAFLESTQFALQNKQAVYHIYNSVNRDKLERYLFSIAEDIMERVVEAESDGLSVSSEDKRYICLFYKHAVVGIILEWLQRGMKDDPEHFIREMGVIFEGNIRSSLEKVSN